MRKSNFGLKVIGGQELENGMVVMKHGQQYSLRLANYEPTLRCDAKITIDGKHIGTFRVDASQMVTIKRPVREDGVFTFFRHGSPEAQAIGLKGDSKEGQIEVEFTPEIVSRELIPELIYSENIITGGTGLTGESGQRFINAERMTKNENKTVLISTRLVCAETPRPL